MDSLFANYASSDDDEPAKGRGRNSTPAPSPPPSKSLFNSLPPPKSSSSSSLFSSLPPSKIAPSPPSSSSSSIFSSLPPPTSKSGPAKPVKVQPSEPKEKKVVQFRPPVYPAALRSVDDDDDDDEEERKRKEKRHLKDFSSKPLSSIIPPPKNSLCLAPKASAFSSRMSVVEAVVPAASAPEVSRPPEEEKSGVEHSGGYNGNWACGSEVEGQYSSGADGGEALQSWTSNNGMYHGSEESYYPNGGDSYESYGSYDGSCGYESAAPNAMPEPSLTIPDMERIRGKRGRNQVPAEFLEVKQEELVKDRPREDKTKLTGIAFGPSYQPVSSHKGKPSKLHKRKHQIGALYFDLKQKEMELTERRSRGMLTKRETQGKYGW